MGVCSYYCGHGLRGQKTISRYYGHENSRDLYTHFLGMARGVYIAIITDTYRGAYFDIIMGITRAVHYFAHEQRCLLYSHDYGHEQRGLHSHYRRDQRGLYSHYYGHDNRSLCSHY